ncbi:merozoite surface glycoprotein, putative [Babesia ovata]|uniref:Merozoite surface glycoprotein, putative n=1 Tax=Babesia ovata TaxID=189622 RepID=A0A2H6KEJ6_9APIC|nr:merozoite surface glycoprotein, putative [Babesia ovata]GBE61379.1 merozoite surface glycoprotein, putative [Babesia ovata]
MLLTKVSLVALCAFIAHAVRAVEDGLSDDSVAQEVASAPRTLKEEMSILSKLLDKDAFNTVEVEKKPDSYDGKDLKPRVIRIRAELASLKSIIDSKKAILAIEPVADDSLPKYKGLNRYLFVKGLMKSIAEKFESLKTFLQDTVNTDSSHLKTELVKLKILKEGDVVGELTVDGLFAFLNAFNAINGPIKNLRKLFRDYEDHETEDGTRTLKSHPFTPFFKDDLEAGESLTDIDEANAETQYIHTPRVIRPSSPSRGTENVGVSGSRADGHAGQTETTLGEPSTTLNQESQSQRGRNDVATTNSVEGPGRQTSGQESVDSANTAPSSTADNPSLRATTGEKSPQKASSAFDPFVTVLLLASAIFAL